MSTQDERVTLLRRAYDAFSRRDVDAVLSLLDPGVDWPNMLDRTTAHGHDAVRAYWERQFRTIDPHVEPTAFLPDGDGVIVAVHQVVRDLEGHRLSDAHVAHAYTFRDKLIRRMTVHPTVEDARR